MGFPIAIELTAANVGDRDGFRLMIEQSKGKIPPIVFADTGYRGEEFEAECKNFGITLKPVPRNEGWCLKTSSIQTIKSFTLVAKRWIVERSFAWLNKYRRMSKDYEFLLIVSKSMMFVVFIRLLLARLG